jgi:hypothetical protein
MIMVSWLARPEGDALLEGPLLPHACSARAATEAAANTDAPRSLPRRHLIMVTFLDIRNVAADWLACVT